MAFEPGRSVAALRRSGSRRGEHRAAVWNTLGKILSLLILAAVLAALGLWIAPELVRRSQLAAEVEAKTAELEKEKALRKKREREKFLLENDREYIETIARDKLDLMKEGETIFRLDGPHPSPAAP